MLLRWARVAVLSLAGLAVLAWWTPALAVQLLLPEQLDAAGLEVQLDGVRPGWPFGIRATRVLARQGEREWTARQLDVKLDPSGWAVAADFEGGTVSLRATPSGDVGLVYFDGVQLEDLSRAWSDVPVRARARGVLRWSQGFEASAHLEAFSVTTPIGMELRLDHVSALLAWQPDGELRISGVSGVGPSGRFALAGRLYSQERLDLRLRIDALEGRIMAILEEVGLAPQTIFTQYEISGTVQDPKLTELAS